MDSENIAAIARAICCPTGCRMDRQCVSRVFAPEAQATLVAHAAWLKAQGLVVVPVGRPRCELVSGRTLDEIRANLSRELHATGDCVLVWMNEGDLIQIGFDAMLAAQEPRP